VVLRGRTLAKIEDRQSVRNAHSRMDCMGNRSIPIPALDSRFGGTEELLRLADEVRGLRLRETAYSIRHAPSPVEWECRR